MAPLFLGQGLMSFMEPQSLELPRKDSLVSMEKAPLLDTLPQKLLNETLSCWRVGEAWSVGGNAPTKRLEETSSDWR